MRELRATHAGLAQKRAGAAKGKSSESLSQFFREGAMRRLGLVLAVPGLPHRGARWGGRPAELGFGGHLSLGSRGLRRVCSQQPVFERGAVKTADDGLHLLRVGRLDEGETFGLLRFGVADDLDGICH